MKKILALLFCVSMVILAACSDSTAGVKNEKTNTSPMSDAKVSNLAISSDASITENTLAPKEVNKKDDEVVYTQEPSQIEYSGDYVIEVIKGRKENTNECAKIICKTNNEVVWTYITGVYPLTELSPISRAYFDNGRVYLTEDDDLLALDINTGEIIWKCEDIVSYGATMIFDEKNIYVSCYYNPHVVIVSKNGEELYRDEDPGYGQVDRVEKIGNKLYIYHYYSIYEDIKDEPAVKVLDITPYI